MSQWRRSLAVYSDRRVLLILPLGFASGLPLLLTFSTLSAWLATAGVSRAAIGAFALVGTPYAFKFLWSPLIDRLPPPLPLGRRRGWGVTIQIALVASMLALGSCDPKGNLATIGRAAAVGDIKGIQLSGLPAWLAWLVVHLWYLVGFENRVLVFIRWSFSFFTHGRGARLITEAEASAPVGLAGDRRRGA